jgi:hypothetical protein
MRGSTVSNIDDSMTAIDGRENSEFQRQDEYRKPIEAHEACKEDLVLLSRKQLGRFVSANRLHVFDLPRPKQQRYLRDKTL